MSTVNDSFHTGVIVLSIVFDRKAFLLIDLPDASTHSISQKGSDAKNNTSVLEIVRHKEITYGKIESIKISKKRGIDRTVAVFGNQITRLDQQNR